MGFSVVCHGCGEVLYEGRDMVPLYRLRAKLDNRCPACGRKLSSKQMYFKECIFSGIRHREKGATILDLSVSRD